MLDNKTIEYKRLSPKYHDDVIIHLRNTFFADEPLNRATKLCQRGDCHAELEQVVSDTLSDDLSIIALTSDGEIAGVALNGWLHKGEVAKCRQKIKECQEDRFRTIFTFLYDENLKVDLFSQFNLDKMFEIRIVSVNENFRGKGIAKQLFAESEKLAKEFGLKKVTASLNYTVVHERYYNTYLDENGERIIPVEPPHEKFQVKYKQLE